MVISCVYQALGTNLELFCNEMDLLLNRVKLGKKDFYICDYNIDLLKLSEHKVTQEFINLMFSKG